MNDLTGLKNASQEKHELKAYYTEIAKQLDNVIKYDQTYALELHDRLQEYIEESRRTNTPMTMADMVLASGVNRDAYYKIRNGDYDWLLPSYMDRHNIPYDAVGSCYTVVDTNDDITSSNTVKQAQNGYEDFDIEDEQEGEKVLLVRLSEILKQAELALQADRERLCMDRNARNAGGAIFLLKAQQGLQDTPQDVRNTQTLNINVASLDEAKEALKRLG